MLALFVEFLTAFILIMLIILPITLFMVRKRWIVIKAEQADENDT